MKKIFYKKHFNIIKILKIKNKYVHGFVLKVFIVIAHKKQSLILLSMLFAIIILIIYFY